MTRNPKVTRAKETDVAQILVAFALGALLCYFLLSVQKPPAILGQSLNSACPQTEICATQTSSSNETLERSATILLPAVDEKGNGAVMPLTVQKRAGRGETLIDINNLVFWFDTQQSIQTAKNVAQKIAATDTSRINIVYKINNESGLVGGPSAGAALTMATLAVLKDRDLNSSIMITGTINPDGTIGPVGGILEKAKAAKGAGAKLFLVPDGQANETTIEPKKTCRIIYGVNYCTTKYSTSVVDVSDAAGITVREVTTISEAEQYFGIS